MKLYIAGAWTDREALQDFMKKVEHLGHTVTHDWTQNELVYDDYHQRSIRCAKADIAGVCDCDLIIAIMTQDTYPYKGTRHELGAAFALREMARRSSQEEKPYVWIVSSGNPEESKNLPECMKCCFEHLADRYFYSVNGVLDALSS